MMSLVGLDGVCAGYGSQQILDHINVHIEAGELIVLMGANGCGKTTLVRVLAGLKHPTGGTITHRHALRKNGTPPIGLAVPPDALPAGLTGFHAIDLVKSALKTDAIQCALDYADRVGLSPRLDHSISGYSTGTKQKLAITLALIGDSPLLLLDESLNGLDLPSVGYTLEYLKTLTQTTRQSVLLVTHNIDLAQLYAQRVWLLDAGTLAREWTQEELNQMQADGRLISRQMLDYFQGAK